MPLNASPSLPQAPAARAPPAPPGAPPPRGPPRAGRRDQAVAGSACRRPPAGEQQHRDEQGQGETDAARFGRHASRCLIRPLRALSSRFVAGQCRSLASRLRMLDVAGRRRRGPKSWMPGTRPGMTVLGMTVLGMTMPGVTVLGVTVLGVAALGRHGVRSETLLLAGCAFGVAIQGARNPVSAWRRPIATPRPARNAHLRRQFPSAMPC